MQNKLRISFICCYKYLFIYIYTHVCIYFVIYIVWLVGEIFDGVKGPRIRFRSRLKWLYSWPCHESKDTHPMTQLSVAMLALQKAPPVKETCNRSSQVVV